VASDEAAEGDSMSEHDLRYTKVQPVALGYGGTIACRICANENLEWHAISSNSSEMSVLIRTRCEACRIASDLHIVWYKGSILMRWYEVKK
jgi:hypothetical protein